MLQTLLDIILYIPRKIVGHFQYIRDLEKENVELEIKINERDLIFKRIVNECDYNKQINNYNNGYLGFTKIKELASTFPNDNN